MSDASRPAASSAPAAHSHRADVPPERPPRRVIVGALVAVVVLQVLFALSYLGAFHDPSPHEVPISVAATTGGGGAGAARQAAAGLEREGGDAVEVRVAADPASARAAVEVDRDAAGALVLGGGGSDTTDRLYVASAAGVAQAQLIRQQVGDAESREGRRLDVVDVAPLPQADSRGTAPFYLVLVMAFGGYLGVTVLSLLATPAAARGRLALERLGGMAAYALVSAVAVVALARLSFGLLEGHLLAATLACALVGYAVASVAVTLQALLGTAGTGLVILLFVVLGNPTAGGAVPYDFLPTPLGAVGPWLVNGAGVDLLRGLLYFDGHAIVRPLLVLAAWAVLGSVGAVTVSAARARRGRTELAPAVAAGL
ncbi:hypothetical protein K8Z61_11160 [Nocardioides sp. TRM66260-LWL]|uniref:hypothetical protein n=1 Tax=Nocardioides sp. TRM66260-LWL TaxID=2874478 RepID=UPI001CC3EB05|nr:hypothetical protein [Nocardioides sp. TRM66260-LWL]MBZ5735057.1 hypothetical protein [Nocardioides sp. TRM66260-LWL]